MLRPAILWNDQRTGPQCEEITAWAGGLKRLLALTGNAVLPGFTAPKIVWVRENEPEIYERVAHILLPKDYIRYRLTGEYATEVSDASGTSLFDVGNRRWSATMAGLLEMPDGLAARRATSRTWCRARSARPRPRRPGCVAGTPVVGGGGDQAARGGRQRHRPARHHLGRPAARAASSSPTPTRTRPSRRAGCTSSATPCRARGTRWA